MSFSFCSVLSVSISINSFVASVAFVLVKVFACAWVSVSERRVGSLFFCDSVVLFGFVSSMLGIVHVHLRD